MKKVLIIKIVAGVGSILAIVFFTISAIGSSYYSQASISLSSGEYSKAEELYKNAQKFGIHITTNEIYDKIIEAAMKSDNFKNAVIYQSKLGKNMSIGEIIKNKGDLSVRTGWEYATPYYLKSIENGYPKENIEKIFISNINECFSNKDFKTVITLLKSYDKIPEPRQINIELLKNEGINCLETTRKIDIINTEIVGLNAKTESLTDSNKSATSTLSELEQALKKIDENIYSLSQNIERISGYIIAELGYYKYEISLPIMVP